MKLLGDYLLQEMAGNTVLFPVGQSVVDCKNIISVNGTGKFILEKLQNEITYDELVEAMMKEYEAAPEEDYIIKDDLNKFLFDLRRYDLLSE